MPNTLFGVQYEASPCKNLEDEADDEDSNEDLSSSQITPTHSKQAHLKASRHTEKMNEAINLFARLDEEKHRKQDAQDGYLIGKLQKAASEEEVAKDSAKGKHGQAVPAS